MTLYYKFAGKVRRGNDGVPGVGKSISVFLAGTATLATLKNEQGAAIDNPLTSNQFGEFGFSIASGIYDLLVDGDYTRGLVIGMPVPADGIVSTVPPTVPSYLVASLPAAATYPRGLAYASNGVKAGEAPAAGTGVLVFSDGVHWIAVDTGATVSA